MRIQRSRKEPEKRWAGGDILMLKEVIGCGGVEKELLRTRAPFINPID